MQRLRDDRGAVSVMVALLMIPLIGFAAIAIDIAAIHSERQQLQTGADAAALAIALDCARGDCRIPQQTAQQFVNANTLDDDAAASVSPRVTPASGRASVTNTGETEHWFAPALGVEDTDITSSATAGWGAPTSGTAALPLAFSLCEFRAQTGGGVPSGTTERTILFTKSSNTGCTGPSGNVVPGGFGWVKTDGNSCRTTSRVGERLSSSPGNSISNGCSSSELRQIRGQTVLLPIFDSEGGQGNNAWYRVHGYAAFKITGYYFSGERWNSTCSGSERCVEGYFTQFVDQSDDFDYGPAAPEMGAAVVSLLSEHDQ